MAHNKKLEKEAEEQTSEQQFMDTVAGTATRSQRAVFDRKMDNMVKLLASLKPIEEQIIDLVAKKMPIMDEIEVLRFDMVRSCVHPLSHLVNKDGVIRCKFCNRQFSVINQET